MRNCYEEFFSRAPVSAVGDDSTPTEREMYATADPDMQTFYDGAPDQLKLEAEAWDTTFGTDTFGNPST